MRPHLEMEEQTRTPEQERERELVAEAARIFGTYGIKSVTMGDLATRMGISKKTLYQYVKDKNDLVGKAVRLVGDQFRKQVTEVLAAGGNAIDELFALTTFVTAQLKDLHPSILYDLEKYHPETYHQVRRARRAEVAGIMTRNMERGIKEGLYRADLNIPMIATVYLARLDMASDTEFFPPEHYDMNALHWELFRYHVRGIATPEGVKYLEKKVKKEHDA